MHHFNYLFFTWPNIRWMLKRPFFRRQIFLMETINGGEKVKESQRVIIVLQLTRCKIGENGTWVNFFFFFFFFWWVKIVIQILRARLVHVFKNWKLLFENIFENTCGWKSTLKYVKCCLKTENCYLKSQTKHPLSELMSPFHDVKTSFTTK